jgi:hypothetical protein
MKQKYKFITKIAFACLLGSLNFINPALYADDDDSDDSEESVNSESNSHDGDDGAGGGSKALLKMKSCLATLNNQSTPSCEGPQLPPEILQGRQTLIQQLEAQIELEKANLKRITLQQKRRILTKITHAIRDSGKIKDWATPHPAWEEWQVGHEYAMPFGKPIKFAIWHHYDELLRLLDNDPDSPGAQQDILEKIYEFILEFDSHITFYNQQESIDDELVMLINLYCFEIYHLPFNDPKFDMHAIMENLAKARVDNDKIQASSITAYVERYSNTLTWIYAFFKFELNKLPLKPLLKTLMYHLDLEPKVPCNNPYPSALKNKELIGFLLFFIPNALDWIKNHFLPQTLPQTTPKNHKPLIFSTEESNEITKLFDTTPPMNRDKVWESFFLAFLHEFITDSDSLHNRKEASNSKILKNVKMHPSDFLNKIETKVNEILSKINHDNYEGDPLELDDHPKPETPEDDSEDDSEPPTKKQKVD